MDNADCDYRTKLLLPPRLYHTETIKHIKDRLWTCRKLVERHILATALAVSSSDAYSGSFASTNSPDPRWSTHNSGASLYPFFSMETIQSIMEVIMNNLEVLEHFLNEQEALRIGESSPKVFLVRKSDKYSIFGRSTHPTSENSEYPPTHGKTLEYFNKFVISWRFRIFWTRPCPDPTIPQKTRSTHRF